MDKWRENNVPFENKELQEWYGKNLDKPYVFVQREEDLFPTEIRVRPHYDPVDEDDRS